jgi:mono/diheme cytochrome c family protein/ABC-type branched-subunit amino acid transport system substrate-binding protein
MVGISTSGTAVAAVVQGDVHVTSREMTCVNCHRRSGMGTAEGNLVVPPILGSVLFAPVTKGAPQIGEPRTTGAGTRPAYTDEALLQALRDGVDPAGRALSPTMPRYAVTAADVQALGAYLRTLGEQPPPGVEEAIVHVATILTPKVSAARRSSMLDVLRAFVRAKNGGTRYETRRREKGPWDMKQQYQGYRDWVLHEWELQGAPREWPAQLEELYRTQPVFAIVGGIADEEWAPVDAFCARHKVPAILPQTPMPPSSPAGDGFYSLYFGKGVTLEALAIAHHLQAGTATHRVRQVSRCSTPGQAAAEALAGELKAAVIASDCVSPEVTLSAETWRTLIGDADTLVAWLDSGDMAGLLALASSESLPKLAELYVSSSLLGEEALRMPEALSARALLVTTFVAPDELDRHAVRSLMWMKANGITPGDSRVAVNAFFAVVLAADALNVPRTVGSREYFVETIEHMASRSVLATAYPAVSFDSKRRFASGGAQILRMPTAPGEAFRKVEEWHVPKS